MKAMGLLIIILAILLPPLYAEENNVIFNTLMTNYIAMTWADFSITYYNLEQGREELNPIARLYIDKPGLTIAFLVLDNLVVSYVTHKIYKSNKIIGMGLIALVTIAKGYILYRNLQEWR